MTPDRLAELVRKTGQRVEVVAARGFTADEFSVHVVTCEAGELRRVASFAGHDYPRARVRMGQYAAEAGQLAWLVRGHRAAYLPLVGAS